ncbi:hypothetical protein B0H16DRAFT_1453243 [Mycena metata]|uniref:Uncharacterized protein n=1 Tax=Mycena metata TaxID=1033252 RepID=A0AAD7JLQ7_9AGAR|nr:hypothetical protein B0H16DRAFT_1453243 [Mycena metata]
MVYWIMGWCEDGVDADKRREETGNTVGVFPLCGMRMWAANSPSPQTHTCPPEGPDWTLNLHIRDGPMVQVTPPFARTRTCLLRSDTVPPPGHRTRRLASRLVSTGAGDAQPPSPHSAPTSRQFVLATGTGTWWRDDRDSSMGGRNDLKSLDDLPRSPAQRSCRRRGGVNPPGGTWTPSELPSSSLCVFASTDSLFAALHPYDIGLLASPPSPEEDETRARMSGGRGRGRAGRGAAGADAVVGGSAGEDETGTKRGRCIDRKRESRSIGV